MARFSSVGEFSPTGTVLPVVEDLARVARDLGLPGMSMESLQELGISSAEGLLGLAVSDPDGLAKEWGISRRRVLELVERLRMIVSPDVLSSLESEPHPPGHLPLGAELGPAPDVGLIGEYDEE